MSLSVFTHLYVLSRLETCVSVSRPCRLPKFYPNRTSSKCSPVSASPPKVFWNLPSLVRNSLRDQLTQNKSMELTSVILCLFSGLLFLSFSLACDCDWDDDCCYSGQWCCKYTETGKKLEKGLCVSRICGVGVCRTQADCFPNKRCDTSSSYKFRCTTECFTDDQCLEIHGQNSGYTCTYSEVLNQYRCKENSDSATNMDADTVRFIYISCAVVGFCLILVCVRQWRKRGQSARQMATRNTLPTRGANAQERRNVESLIERPAALQMTANQTQIEHSNGLTVDAIALSGPPSYVEVGDVPESPPPTYEEATKA